MENYTKYIIFSINTWIYNACLFTKTKNAWLMMDHAMTTSLMVIIITYRLSCTIINYYTILNLVTISDPTHLSQ